MAKTQTEKTLIALAQKGDKKAISALVNKYSPRIYAIAFRLMQNEEDAEDVLQETFIIMIKKLHTFEGKSSLYTWLYRVATNVALGKLRKKKNVDDSVTIDGIEFENLSRVEHANWPENIEDEFETKEFRKCLNRAMEELPDHYRTVFILRDLEGHSTRNTSKILDISEANVKVRLMRARLYLRDQMLHNLKCIHRDSYER